MKTLWNFILFLAVLCLAGCSSEDPQSVAFSMKEMTVDSKSNFIKVDIQSNCAWTIRPEKGNPVSSMDAGVGPATITVSVKENVTYDDMAHAIAIYSEDGTSADRLNITQKAAFGLEAVAPDMLDCEGGTFDVKVNTNDEIEKVDVPEWITFTGSRALTGYTYTFTAEPNKTGSPRTGSVRIVGKNKATQFDVKQDSYAPTGVDVSGIPKVVPIIWEGFSTVAEPLFYPIQIIPEYADYSKLSVKSSVEEVFKASIVDSTVKIEFEPGYGSSINKHRLDFFSGDVKIASAEFSAIQETLYDYKKITTCKGSTFSIPTNFLQTKYYDFILPENGGITYLGNFKFKANIEGDYKITMVSLLSGRTKDIDVKVSKYVAKASASYSVDVTPWIWNIKLSGSIASEKISNCVSYFIDKGSNVQVPINKKESSTTTNTINNTFQDFIVAYSVNELKSILSNFVFVFEATIDGEKIAEEIPLEIE